MLDVLPQGLLSKTNMKIPYSAEKIISRSNARSGRRQSSVNGLRLFPARSQWRALNLFFALLYWPRFPDMRRGTLRVTYLSFKLNEEKHE